MLVQIWLITFVSFSCQALECIQSSSPFSITDLWICCVSFSLYNVFLSESVFEWNVYLHKMHSTTTNADAVLMTGWGWVLHVMLAPTFRPVSFVLTHRNQSSCEVGCSVEEGYAIRRLNVIFISKRTFTVYTWHWQLYLCSSPVPFFRTPETRETNQLRPFKTDCLLVTATSAPPHQHTDFVLWFFLLKYGHDGEHESW